MFYRAKSAPDKINGRRRNKIRNPKHQIRNKRGQNKSQIRKIKNEESESDLFGTLHLFLVI